MTQSSGLFRDDDALEPAADDGEGERRRHDAEHGRRRERREPHAAQCGNEIEQPEGENRHQPQNSR